MKRAVSALVLLSAIMTVHVEQAAGQAAAPAAGLPNGDLVDYASIPRLRWVGDVPPGTFAEYLAGRPAGPLATRKIDFPEPPAGARGAGGAGRVLVLINSQLQAAIPGRLGVYVADLQQLGYEVLGYTALAGTAEELKSLIVSLSANLIGCVLVGDLPCAWYEKDGDSFPCDLFLMDLDGSWSDADQDGKYDGHGDGGGDEAPDIFAGRIDASRISYAGEVDLMKDYFDKLHAYYQGTIPVTNHALTYTEDDWAGYYDMCNDVGFAYESYEVIKAPDTNMVDYRDNRLKSTAYDFIQLACHSYSGGHAFTRLGWLMSDVIYGLPPRALYYNLFCCSASRFTDQNCLGGVYVFNGSLSALATVGSTKSGSMLAFDKFYTPLGEGKTFGRAFQEWFEALAPYSPSEVDWHFGMTIIGDPLVRPRPPRIVADAKINGKDGPLALPQSQGIAFTLSLDPGEQSGVPHDWWVFAQYAPPWLDPWWWRHPSLTWTRSPQPLRAYGGPLITISDFLVGSAILPKGDWVFSFALDALDNAYQGTVIDTVEVMVY